LEKARRCCTECREGHGGADFDPFGNSNADNSNAGTSNAGTSNAGNPRAEDFDTEHAEAESDFERSG
jgi:hypothetical protein